ncbi:phage holin family protein [Loktanella sp. F6476L]|uniref:phage holin family protein n=1 Tax=Loktanella sp. F6476L TaxID=2926405 RepID=UPI001FF2CCA5|nr:phage holin family protein [Loktanella sp. F6476L]MCK0122362.1 phage holin family protein [Loktanella sp. F6476L]
MKPDTAPRDMSTAISSVLSHVHALLRKEVALLKSEMADRMNHVAIALGLMGLALVLVLTALQVLTGAAVALFVEMGLTPAQAAGAVALIALLIAAVVGMKALRMLKSASLVPHDTIATIQKDTTILKETYSD